VNLSDEDPDIVKIYLQWIYAQAFPIRKDMDSRKEEVRYKLATLAHCYVFGENLMDRDFKQAALNAYCEAWEYYASSPNISKMSEVVFDATPVITIYEGTPSGSEFRKRLVMYWLRARDPYREGSFDALDGLPADFVADFTEALRQMDARRSWYGRST
jgi:hypothetical protein